MVFQDPFAAMNPRMLISDIIAEGITALYPEVTETERKSRVRQLLQQVGLPE
jgi:ABC-type microcin C transport system duplicated ATPase subunit YejF